MGAEQGDYAQIAERKAKGEPGGLGDTSNEGIGELVEIAPANAAPWPLILVKKRSWDLD
ncbi:MAG: hypothetical protein MO846_06135 [Candidatus Devosia symbiotica]|nr:hypothetical protein [Candidatus Devosia symbiotica]